MHFDKKCPFVMSQRVVMVPLPYFNQVSSQSSDLPFDSPGGKSKFQVEEGGG